MSIEDQIKQIATARDKEIALAQRAEAQAACHRSEAEKLSIAIDVLQRMDFFGNASSVPVSRSSSVQGSKPIWARILDVMRASEKVWWTANEIQDALGAEGAEVKMTSISPNLTRLKEGGDIVRDDLKVALAARAPKKTEAPEDDVFGHKSSEASNQDRLYQSAEPAAQGREAGPGGWHMR